MPLTTAKRFQAGVSVKQYDSTLTVTWQCSLKQKNAFFNNYFF